MLADSCPDCGVPLMRRDAATVCVNCTEALPPSTGGAALPNGNGLHHSDGSDASDPGDVDVVAAPPPLRELLNERRRVAEASHDASASGAAAARTPAAEDATQVMADRMLEGWALLAEHCPQ